MILTASFMAYACAVQADDVISVEAEASIVILGEVHDNPAHHQAQALVIADLQPTAVVYEMLTVERADQVTPDLVADQKALEAVLEWDASGWPDFAMYYPVFSAAPQARVFGAAVPRAQTRSVFAEGIESLPEAKAFALDQPLPAQEQVAREALQQEAHCNALPSSALPGMVTIQRLRDARLAQISLQALRETGGPVVVITGNGHARKDWGVPHLLQQVEVDVDVFVLGQSEDGREPEGGFDRIIDAPSIPRPDPCEAFK